MLTIVIVGSYVFGYIYEVCASPLSALYLLSLIPEVYLLSGYGVHNSCGDCSACYFVIVLTTTVSCWKQLLVS